MTEATAASPARVEVRSPLSPQDLRSIPSGPCVVQFGSQLSTSEHDQLGRWFADRPDAELRVYTGEFTTLDFLSAYPALTAFTLDSEISDASGLAHLPDSLRSLSVSVRLPRRTDLDVLARFRRLDELGLGSVRRLPESARGLPVTKLSLGGVKTLDGIDSLPDVRELGLQSASADLAPLTDLRRLEDLALSLGGCKDLIPVAEIGTLRRFSATMVRGLDDVRPLAELSGLEELYLSTLRRVVELPQLDGARSLVYVALDAMRGLRDLTRLRDAPALRELLLIEMEHLQPDEVAVLAGHLTLTDVQIGLGSDRKNLAVRDALRIPGSYGGHDWPPSSPCR